MYSVVIAEDEPIALKSVCRVLEKHCPNLKIVGTAGNGETALKMIRNTKPDLVITDIRMPRPDGLELAKIVRSEMPETQFIIISGYQEFEYARQALQMEVVDYILKPVTPTALKDSAGRAAIRIRSLYYQHRIRLFRQISNEEDTDPQELKKYFPEEKYYAALVRYNGVPGRFSYKRCDEIFSDVEEHYYVFGRDEQESLYILPSEIAEIGVGGKGNFIHRLNLIDRGQAQYRYYTVIYSSTPFAPDHLKDIIDRFYRYLDYYCVIGKNREIDIQTIPNDDDKTVQDQYESRRIVEQMEKYVRISQNNGYREDIQRICQYAYDNNKSRLWLEGILRQIEVTLLRNSRISMNIDDFEHALDDALTNSTAPAELADIISEIFALQDDNRDRGTPGKKSDADRIFEQIQDYIAEHLAEDISLSVICREFNVSQTYLSRLFRKYTGDSYVHYVTRQRMLRAELMLKDDPDCYIKDVAIQVGYGDQFYFSRVFRSFTGKSPSQYIADIDAEGS